MNIYIVSPSGHFYGSEQVLYNFLEHTQLSYKVFVPKDSIIKTKLEGLSLHEIISFASLYRLYAYVCWKLIVGDCNTLYLNEGGHIRYVKLLARCFPKRRFFVHIRLLEDCHPNRLGRLPSNIHLISISQFISSRLQPYKAKLIHDPLNTTKIKRRRTFQTRSIYRIGIVGRVSPSKGLTFYRKFFNHLIAQPSAPNFEFLFFGDLYSHLEEVQQFCDFCHSLDLSISFKGFVSDQNQVYDNLDIVLHLNPQEPLGRIGLESWARGMPFLGFNEGGVGEINTLLGQETFCVARHQDWPKQLHDKLCNIANITSPRTLQLAKENLVNHFGVHRYVTEVESLFESM